MYQFSILRMVLSVSNLKPLCLAPYLEDFLLIFFWKFYIYFTFNSAMHFELILYTMWASVKAFCPFRLFQVCLFVCFSALHVWLSQYHLLKSYLSFTESALLSKPVRRVCGSPVLILCSVSSICVPIPTLTPHGRICCSPIISLVVRETDASHFFILFQNSVGRSASFSHEF